MAPQSSQLDSETLAWIALASAQRVSPKLWLQALEKYQLSTVDLGSNTSSLPNEVKQLTNNISPPLIDAAINWLQTSDNRHIVPLSSPHYPELLKQLDSPPLYCLGSTQIALGRASLQVSVPQPTLLWVAELGPDVRHQVLTDSSRIPAKNSKL